MLFHRLSRATKPGRDHRGEHVERDGDSISVSAEIMPSSAERSATYIGAFALLGRLVERASAFGLIVLIAAAYGSSFSADLYFIASIAPLLIGSTAGDAISTALLPALVRGEAQPEAEARVLASGFWFVVGALSVMTVAYVGVAAVVVRVAAPAGNSRLAPWVAFAPLIVLLGVSGYLAAVLLRFQRYVWPPLRAAFASLGAFVLTAVALAFSRDITYVAVAVTAGWSLSVALMAGEVVHVSGTRVFGRPSWAALRELFGLAGRTASAALTGLLGGQAFVLMERLIASTSGVGAVSTLSYARGIAFTPNLFGQAVAVGVYPGMVRAHERREVETVQYYFLRGLRLTLLIGVGTAAYLAVFGTPLASAVLQRGKLGSEAADAVGTVLSAFALALIGNLLLILLTRTFFATDYFAAAAWAQSVVVAVYVLSAIPLRDAWGLPGLALAFGVAEFSGGIFGLALAARRLQLSVGQLLSVAVIPAVTRSTLVVVPLLLYRLVTAETHAPQALQGLINAGGSALLFVAMTAFAVWTARWPETERLKAVARRVLWRG
jgi:putative peptidoglycan lipid II flippase